jgi:excisionase family DNA binding protein
MKKNQRKDKAMQEENDKECTIAEYAKKYSISRYTINKAVEREKLPSRKSGNTHLIKQADFDAWYAKYLQSPRIQKKQNGFSEKPESDQKTP